MTSACSAGAARTGGSLAGPSASRSVEAVAVSGTKGGLWSSLLDHLLNQAPPPWIEAPPLLGQVFNQAKGAPGECWFFRLRTATRRDEPQRCHQVSLDPSDSGYREFQWTSVNPPTLITKWKPKIHAEGHIPAVPSFAIGTAEAPAVTGPTWPYYALLTNGLPPSPTCSMWIKLQTFQVGTSSHPHQNQRDPTCSSSSWSASGISSGGCGACGSTVERCTSFEVTVRYRDVGKRCEDHAV